MAQVRWKCKECGEGLLASSRPRKDDVRRYCLPCSAKSGRLVERVAPALEKKRTESSIKSKEKYKKKNSRISSKVKAERTHERLVKKRELIVKKEAERLWELYRPYHKGAPLPQIRIDDTRQNRGASGFCTWSRTLIVIRLVPYSSGRYHETRNWKVLLHELGHAAVGIKSGDTHSRELYQAMKDVAQRRWKTSISYGSLRGNRWGYHVDAIIEQQLCKADVVRFELPVIRQRQIEGK